MPWESEQFIEGIFYYCDRWCEGISLEMDQAGREEIDQRSADIDAAARDHPAVRRAGHTPIAFPIGLNAPARGSS